MTASSSLFGLLFFPAFSFPGFFLAEGVLRVIEGLAWLGSVSTISFLIGFPLSSLYLVDYVRGVDQILLG